MVTLIIHSWFIANPTSELKLHLNFRADFKVCCLSICHVILVAIQQMSELLETGLDPETLSICVHLCEQGVNPEALASVVKELRREMAAYKVRGKLIQSYNEWALLNYKSLVICFVWNHQYMYFEIFATFFYFIYFTFLTFFLYFFFFFFFFFFFGGREIYHRFMYIT